MRCWWAWVGFVRWGEQCRHRKEYIMQGLRGGIATNGYGFTLLPIEKENLITKTK